MKTLCLIGIFLVPFIVVGTIESMEHQDKYNQCIQSGSNSVYTDMDAELLERKCKWLEPSPLLAMSRTRFDWFR